MEGVGFEPGFIVWLLNFPPYYLFFLHPSSTNLSALSSFHCFQPLKSVRDQPFHSPLDYITPHHLRILIRQFSPVLFIFDLPSALILLILKNKNENKTVTLRSKQTTKPGMPIFPFNYQSFFSLILSTQRLNCAPSVTSQHISTLLQPAH